MLVRMTAMVGLIAILAFGAIDYKAAADARPGGQPLSLTDHMLDRVAMAKAAVGLSSTSEKPAPRLSSGTPAVPDSAFGKALAVMQASLTGDTDAIFSSAGPVASVPEAVASGDHAALSAAVQSEFGKVAASLDGLGTPQRGGRSGKARTITVGIGSCTKGGVGKFCSVAPAKKN